MVARLLFALAVSTTFVAPACAEIAAGVSSAVVNETVLKTSRRRASHAANLGSFSGIEYMSSSIGYVINHPIDVLLRIPVLRAHVAGHLWLYQQLGGTRLGSSQSEANLIRTAQGPEPVEQLEAKNKSPHSFFMDWVFTTFFATSFGILFYKQKQITGRKQDANPEKTFSGGHFLCCEDLHTAVCAFFCPGLRWADTINMFGVANDINLLTLSTFWTLFVMFAFTNLIDVVFSISTAVLLTSFRQKVRERMELPHGECGIVVIDFFFALCCPCCLIAQEARTANEMQLVGKLVVVDAQGVPSYGSSAA